MQRLRISLGMDFVKTINFNHLLMNRVSAYNFTFL